MAEPARTLITNASVLDPARATITPDSSVLVEGDRIADVGPRLTAQNARMVDARGRTVMPGLIDCHVHLTAAGAHLGEVAEWSPMYVSAHAGQIARGMLRRGFTTVRDAGGADYGLARAIAEGLFEGPRLIFGGAALSQTGGHGDLREAGRMSVEAGYPYSSLGLVIDGVPAMRRAVREELKRGAHHIKLMLSGGVASPTDRVDSTQFSAEEIRAAVEEADAANRYVLAHAYTSRAIRRGLELGVRTIEHGNLMDESIPPLFLQHNAYYVPTLVTYSALAEHGRELGLPESSHRKVFDVMDAGLHALELAHRAGLSIAFGSDLLGDMHRFQSREFAIRSQVQPAADVLRSATVVGARVVRMEGQIATLTPGAYADLLMVDGNPLDNIGLLAQPETSLKLVMKAGRIYREE